MSTINIEVVKINNIIPHDNADKLEIAYVNGFPCIVQKGVFHTGDLGVYFPVDIVAPIELLQKLLSNSKVKFSERIKAVRIRGVYSEGLLFSLNNFSDLGQIKEGDILTENLGCKKYEPIEADDNVLNTQVKKNKKIKKKVGPRYIDTERGEKYFDKCFSLEDEVHVSVKLHGTSVRYFWTDLYAVNWFWSCILRIKKFFGFNTRRFICGSRNIDKELISKNGYYESNVYATIARQLNLPEKLNQLEKNFGKQIILFGEIVGYGIQKRFNYGCKNGELKFFAYAVMIDEEYVNLDRFLLICRELNVETVPYLFVGQVKDMPSVSELLKKQYPYPNVEHDIPCREGIVIATVIERASSSLGKRTIVKFINPEYNLLKDPGDKH